MCRLRLKLLMHYKHELPIPIIQSRLNSSGNNKKSPVGECDFFFHNILLDLEIVRYDIDLRIDRSLVKYDHVILNSEFSYFKLDLPLS